MRFTVNRMDHIVLTVKDRSISASWYQRVLGMDIEEYGRNNRVALRFGGQKINLRPADADGWETAQDAAPGGGAICASRPPSTARTLFATSITAAFRSSKGR